MYIMRQVMDTMGVPKSLWIKISLTLTTGLARETEKLTSKAMYMTAIKLGYIQIDNSRESYI